MEVFRLPRSRCSYRCGYGCGCYCGLIRCVTGRSALWSVVGSVLPAVCCAGRLPRSVNAAAPRTRSSAVPWAALGVRPQLTFLFIVSHECRAYDIVKSVHNVIRPTFKSSCYAYFKDSKF